VAKGRQKYQARQQALSSLGTPLSRRAKARCELCSSGGIPLRPHEVEPDTDDPEFDRCILLCDRCKDGVAGGSVSPQEWRFLEQVAWTEITALQVAAVRMLRSLAESESWASALLDTLYLAPEADEWLRGA
jgi:protein PhnA